MDVADVNIQPLNMEDSTESGTPPDYNETEQDLKMPHRKTSFARSMSVPNSVANTLFFPNTDFDFILIQ